MRLADCNASFFGTYGGRSGIGVIFDCPLCIKEGRTSDDCHSIPVHFLVALDGQPVPEEIREWVENGVKKKFVIPRWARTGDTIDTLTLSPSVNADSQDHGTHKGWHGFIQNGNVTGV